MDTLTICILAGLGVMVIGMIGLIMFYQMPIAKRATFAKRFYRKAYVVCSTNFVTSGKMNNISTRMQKLSLFSKDEICKWSTQYLLMSYAVAIGIIVAGFVLYSDIVSQLLCVLFAIVIEDEIVNKQLNKIGKLVTKQLKIAIGSIRQQYLVFESIPQAIESAEIPVLVRRPFDEILNILTSTDSDMNLLKFHESNPYPALKTFADIAVTINTDGDTKDEEGRSNFINALTILQTDINTEIYKDQQIKRYYGNKALLAVVPIFMCKPLESMFISNMPGTATLYYGTYGYFSRMGIILACIIAFKAINMIASDSSVKLDDRSYMIVKLLRNKWFSGFISDIAPKQKARRKLQHKLDKALSKKSVEHVTAERVVYGGFAFFAVTLALVTAIQIGHDFMYANTGSLGLTESPEMANYSAEQIQTLDVLYMNRDHEWSEEEFKGAINSYMPGLTDMQLAEQIARLKSKDSAVLNAYFKWFYSFISIAAFMVGWKLPDIMNMLREKVTETESVDEFLQLQTLMAIIMNTNMDTLDAIWQLSQHAVIYSDQLTYCYHSYVSNPDRELVRLQSKVAIPEFKRFIGKLQLIVSDLSLREAFGDLKRDRDSMVQLRNEQVLDTIKKKATYCGYISNATLYLTVGLEGVIPILMLGVTQVVSSMGGGL